VENNRPSRVETESRITRKGGDQVNWLKKRIDIRPTLLVGVILALLIGSAGVAFALSVGTPTGPTSIWPGEADVTAPAGWTVTYDLIYTDDLTQLDKVDISITTGGADVNVDVQVAAGTGSTWATGSQLGNTASTIQVDITDLDLDDFDELNIIIEETS
jgi:hypothetical protein